MKYALGIDIGGTNTVVGLVNKEGKVLGTDSVKTQSFPVLEEYVKTVSKLAKDLIAKNNVSVDDIVGMGIGAPNANYYTGNIEMAPNLPWKQDKVPLAKMFREELNIPVTITNDANAAALGEKMYGVAKDMDNFIMITLGTGVGSGIVINGQLVYGHDGFAGELGHVIIERNGRLCGCGRRGCLETYCSATGIVRTAKERNTPFLTSKDIYDAAVKGDETAIDIFKETGTRLGRALADMVVFSSPEAFVLFGGLAKAGDFIVKPKEELEKIAALAKKHQFWVISDEIYCELVYDGSEHVSIGSFPGMKDYTIILNGFSKSFAMTGWRIGYIAAPNELLSQIVKVHGYNTICAPIFSQYAAAEGLRNGWKEVEKMRVSYQQRRNLMEKAFNEMGLPVPEPKGAFYMFPDISSTGLSSEEFATRLFKEHNVAVVPGSVFGAGGEGHIRVCYATAVDKIKVALERIELMVKSLK